jgi:hypothetical protein
MSTAPPIAVMDAKYKAEKPSGFPDADLDGRAGRPTAGWAVELGDAGMAPTPLLAVTAATTTRCVQRGWGFDGSDAGRPVGGSP